MPAKNSGQRGSSRAEQGAGTAGAASAAGTASGPGFEKRLERLEAIASRLREESLPLEEAIGLFEEGMKLSKGLDKELARVERRVEILTREPDAPGEEPGLELFPELDEEDGAKG